MPETHRVAVWSATITRLAPKALLGLGFVWAFVAGSNLFQVSSWIGGDIAYHRGVAYTMQGVDWQGEGPYVGLLTYYGGLYPLILGRLAASLGQTFDTVLSVASWGLALLWPLACWWLGRRIWPGRPLAVALFVLLAVTAAPFTNRTLLWVDSPLASAQVAFPTYPRDLALVLLVVAVGYALSDTRRQRIVGIGLAVGLMILVHLQIAILTGWILASIATIAAVRRRTLDPVVDLALAGLIAVVISAWWWIPRVVATIQSGGLWLTGYPGNPPLRVGLDNVFVVLGVVAVLALLGLAVLAARRPLPGLLWPFLAWIVVSLPLIALDRLVGGSDLVSERRVWLLMSIPLTVLAAATATAIAGKLRPLTLVAFIAVIVVLPSLPGSIFTARLVRTAWPAGQAGGRIFDPAAWDPLFADLNARVRADGRHVAVTYDAYETWVWSFSGAQVPSVWLPGPFKLGFDPQRATGLSQGQRLSAQETAFDGGRRGICGLAGSSGAGSIILDVEQGLLGTYDESPAMPDRVDPRVRSAETIEREVRPGETYMDRGSYDTLELAPGATWQPEFRSPGIRLLALEFVVPEQPHGTSVEPTPLGAIRTAHGDTTFGAGLPAGPARVVVPVNGVGDDLSIAASRTLDLTRVTGFEPAPEVTAGTPNGPIRFDPATFCHS